MSDSNCKSIYDLGLDMEAELQVYKDIDLYIQEKVGCVPYVLVLTPPQATEHPERNLPMLTPIQDQQQLTLTLLAAAAQALNRPTNSSEFITKRVPMKEG